MAALKNSRLAFGLYSGDTFLHTLAQAAGRARLQAAAGAACIHGKFDSGSLMLGL